MPSHATGVLRYILTRTVQCHVYHGEIWILHVQAVAIHVSIVHHGITASSAAIFHQAIPGSRSLEQLAPGVTCRTCNLRADTPESMGRHTFFCPMGGLRNKIHKKGLAHQIAARHSERGRHLSQEHCAGAQVSAGPNTRPGDVILLSASSAMGNTF